MVARPRREIWHSIAQAVGRNLGWGDAFTQWIAQRGKQSLFAVPRAMWLRAIAVVPAPRLHLTPMIDRLTPGGNSMIFRKDNRGESFQRQISSLRHQLESESDNDTDDYNFEERQDTSQFSTAQPESREREETYTPARSTESAGTTQFATQPTSTPYRAGWQAADSNTSVIAANAHWNGTLRSEGSLHVHGRADGELHATSDLYVAEGAQIDAELFADNVVVAGVVRGRIEARSRLEVLPQGHVSGDVKAPKLVVHEGARLTGQLKMESGAGGVPAESPYSTVGQGSKSRRSKQ